MNSYCYNSDLPNINILAYDKINALDNDELSNKERDRISNEIKILDDTVYIVDDILQSELSAKIRNNFPNIAFILGEDGKLVDVTILEKTEKPKTYMELIQEENAMLKLQVSAMNTNQTFLEDCIIELAQEVYK